MNAFYRIINIKNKYDYKVWKATIITTTSELFKLNETDGWLNETRINGELNWTGQTDKYSSLVIYLYGERWEGIHLEIVLYLIGQSVAVWTQ